MSNPHNLIIDRHDQVWFAVNTLPYIGRLNPKSGSVTKYPMPDRAARDPHRLVEFDIGKQAFDTVIDVSPLKLANMKRLGANTVLVPGVYAKCEKAAHAAVASQGKTFFSPYSPPDVIVGQGTIGLELDS